MQMIVNLGVFAQEGGNISLGTGKNKKDKE